MEKEIRFMKQAIKEAQKAELIDEVPIGCVIVCNDKIVARGHNVRETKKTSLGHAEMVAISKANKKLNKWRLEDCDIYITLEPCIMCAGSIIQSRFKRVIYGADDLKGGAFGSSINVMNAKNINHHPEIISGILNDECAKIISNYFKKKREEKR